MPSRPFFQLAVACALLLSPALARADVVPPSEKGCGCSVPESTAAGAPFALAGAGLLAFAGRRRRRHSRARK